ncbi:hypothetical protein H4S04_003996 [Coemansia sp. S16]|nr:hypothetical protein H4S04_003996 [Coemansia sp. S16]
MTAGPPTGQTGVKLNMPSATDKRTSDDKRTPDDMHTVANMHTSDDMHTFDDMSEDDTDTPSAKGRSSFDGQGCADNSLAQVVSAVISANVVSRHRECKNCSRYCMELYEAKLEMVLALRSCQTHSARRNADCDVQLSRRLRDVLFSAIEAFRAMGYKARCHAWTHYHDNATPATGKSTAATSAPANNTCVVANASSVTGCLPGDRPPAGRTQTATSPVASILPASSQTAAPLVDDTTSAPSQGAATFKATMTPAPFLVAAASMASTTAHTQTATSAADTTTPAPSEGAATFEATMTPAPFQVAAASTDTTPAASYQVAAPSAPSNNGASLGLNPAGQGPTEEHTPAPPRARQTPSFIARRLQKVVVVKQRNPADRSKIRRIAVPIRTRQCLKGRYRSLATRYDLERLGLGFRDNGASVRQRFTNSPGVVRLGSGMTLRDNRLRRRRRTSPVNEIRVCQRQRARKEMRASQRLRKYPATTPAINVIPATPPAIPSGGGATGWFPVGWSNFDQGAQTDVTTPTHVQLATTPAAPTLIGPTQTITPIDPTQATFMTATPAPPTAFAPTGIAQTIIPPATPTGIAPTGPTQFTSMAAAPTGLAPTGFAQTTIPPATPTGFAPTGFASTTTATASPASNAPTQAGLTLPPPTSTGPAPPATTFTFTSTSGPSRIQPQNNGLPQCAPLRQDNRRKRLNNRPGNGAAKQQAKTPGALEATFDIEEVAELTDLKEEHPDVMQKYPWILWRRQRIGPKIATENTWLIDRMYYALLRLAATRAKYVANFDLEKELRILGEANDGTIVARHREESDGENINAIEGVDVSALRGGVFC